LGHNWTTLSLERHKYRAGPPGRGLGARLTTLLCEESYYCETPSKIENLMYSGTQEEHLKTRCFASDDNECDELGSKKEIIKKKKK
jgi:hypothetical protein